MIYYENETSARGNGNCVFNNLTLQQREYTKCSKIYRKYIIISNNNNILQQREYIYSFCIIEIEDECYTQGLYSTWFHWESSQTGFLPNDSTHGSPPNQDSSETGLLPENAFQNWNPPKTGFLPRWDSPEVGFLSRRDSSRDRRSSIGGISGGRSSQGGILFSPV